MHLVLIGLGGFAGAIARYLVDGWATGLGRGTFPWGTFAVNLTGSLMIGILFALMIERAALSADLRGPLMIGFIGSYTTFSTLALESWRLLEDGAWLLGRRTWPDRCCWAWRRWCRHRHREGAGMRIEGQGLLVRIYIGESDKHDGMPLYEAIVQRLARARAGRPPCCAGSRASAPTRACTPPGCCGSPRTCRS